MKSTSLIIVIVLFFIFTPIKSLAVEVGGLDRVELQNSVEGYIDYDKNISIDSITNQKSVSFKKIPFKPKIPLNTPVWYKMELSNTNSNQDHYILYHKAISHEEVDYYILHKNGHIEHFATGSTRSFNSRIVKTRVNACKINLEANNSVTVYARIATNGSENNSEFTCQKEDSFYSRYALISSYSGIFFGFTIAVLIHSLSSYIIQKRSTFLFYFIHIGSMTTYMAISNGFVLQILSNTPLPSTNDFVRFFITVSFVSFIVLYMKLLRMDRNSIITKTLKLFIIYELAFVVYYLLALFTELPTIKVLIFVVIPNFIAVLIMTIESFRKKKDDTVAWFAFVGLSGYCMSNLIYALGAVGAVTLGSWAVLLIVFALIWEGSWFLMALSWKNRELQLKKNAQDMQLAAQERFVAMGEVAVSIAHQWRQPLNKITSILLALKPTPELIRIEQIAVHMSQTIEDFMRIFQEDRPKEEFWLSSQIQKSIDVFNDFTECTNMTISLNVVNDSLLKTNPREITQLIGILLENAQDSFVNLQIIDPIVDIEIDCDEKFIYITVNDNAGGIRNDIMERIFEPFFSTKESGNRSGVGLYIAKTIIEKGLGGNISMKNKGGGACCYVTIPINQDFGT